MRGPGKHLKRLAAPRHWMLDKLSGIYAPKPSSGPHKFRECLPMILLIRGRLKYALTRSEVTKILMQRHVKVDHKVRTDINYPVGFQDVVQIEKTDEHFRLLLDTKGRFVMHRITPEEAQFKLLRVKTYETGPKGVPFITTHDGRTIRYVDPAVNKNDTVKFDLKTKKVVDWVKFDVGHVAMVTGGHNKGRVGIITHRERHPGSFDIMHLKDAAGATFATRLQYTFIIGHGNQPLISLPRNKGVRRSILEERDARMKKAQGK